MSLKYACCSKTDLRLVGLNQEESELGFECNACGKEWIPVKRNSLRFLLDRAKELIDAEPARVRDAELANPDYTDGVFNWSWAANGFIAAFLGWLELEPKLSNNLSDSLYRIADEMPPVMTRLAGLLSSHLPSEE